jgi:hypothetical protein
LAQSKRPALRAAPRVTKIDKDQAQALTVRVCTSVQRRSRKTMRTPETPEPTS